MATSKCLLFEPVQSELHEAARIEVGSEDHECISVVFDGQTEEGMLTKQRTTHELLCKKGIKHGQTMSNQFGG